MSVVKQISDNVRTTYNFRTLVKCLARLDPRTTPLLRGRHGIGKSAIAYQMAEVWGYDTVIERRISQLSEADMIGMPDRDAIKIVDPDAKDGPPKYAHNLLNEYDKEKGGWRVTRFLSPDWFLEAMLRPCLVFFDEINRGTPEVQQACFEFVERGRLNGREIHEGSRVIAAVNDSREYQVTPMDPAFLDRFWIANVEPDKEDWLEWGASDKGMTVREKELYGEQNIHPAIIEFIRSCDADHFEIMPEKQAQMDQSIRTPSRRSWHKLSQHLTRKLNDEPGLIDNPSDPTFIPLGRGFVGQPAIVALKKKLVETVVVTPEDIVNRFDKVKKRIKQMEPEAQIALVKKLGDYIEAFDIRATEAQAKNLKKMYEELPAEIAIKMWTMVSATNNHNAALFHRMSAKFMMDSIAETKACNAFQKMGSA